MKKITLLIYPFICIWIVAQQLLLNGWETVFDITTLQSVLIPTIAYFFIYEDISINKRLAISLKVCWFSGGVTFLYGVINAFSYFEADFAQAIFPSLAVALLPLFYCFVISLLLAPYVYKSK